MVRILAFDEGDETRESRPIDLAALCEFLHCDGIWVDIDDPTDRVSYELMPGRQVIAWHGDECHD